MTLSKYVLEQLILMIFEWFKQALPYLIYIIFIAIGTFILIGLLSIIRSALREFE